MLRKPNCASPQNVSSNVTPDEMRKNYFILTFLTSCIICLGQGPKERIINNKNCPELKTTPFIVEELTITDVEITEYLSAKYPKDFLTTAVEFNLILLPKNQPCCKSYIIVDPTQITKPQADTLLKHIINFPGFSKIKIDKPKRLRLFVANGKKNRPTCTFISSTTK